MPSARLIEVTKACSSPTECAERDAIIFVHGIYGGADTFINGGFNWPMELPRQINGRTIDVYLLEYQTALRSWRKTAAFDEIANTVFEILQGKRESGYRGVLAERPYRSVGFIAHSLGGNVVAAYIHTVKSELGHPERARNSFLITLGTPADGALIANLAVALKAMLGMRDPLLKSLTRDNPFLRMLTRWRTAEDVKASRLNFRPVHLYVGVEGMRIAGMKIVSEESAKKPYSSLAKDIRVFDRRNHSQMAKPASKNDDLYLWVDGIIRGEMERLDQWTS